MILIKLAILLWFGQALADTDKPKPPLTFEDIVSLVENPDNDLKSVTDLFKHFRKQKDDPRFQDYFDCIPLTVKGATPLFKSESRHKDAIDKDHFRIVAVNGNLVFAISTNPEFPELFEDLEVFEFLPETEKTVVHEIKFPGREPHFRKERIMDVTRQPDCAACHGNPSHFLWGAEGMNPGTLDHGAFFTNPEKTYVDQLKTALPANERYSLFEKGLTHVDKYDDGTYEAYWSSNLNFYVNDKNQRRMARELKDSKEVWPRYRYAVYGALMDCPDLENFLPAEFQAAHTQRLLGRTMEKLVNDTKQIISDERESRVQRFKAASVGSTRAIPEDGVTKFASKIAKLRYLLEGQPFDPKLKMSNWAISREPKKRSYTLFSNFDSTDHFLQKYLAPEEMKADPELASHAEILFSDQGAGSAKNGVDALTENERKEVRAAYCEKLKNKSLANFLNVKVPPVAITANLPTASGTISHKKKTTSDKTKGTY